MESKEAICLRLRAMSGRMRKQALRMALSTGTLGAHVAPGLSIIEICAVLYGAVMKLRPEDPRWEERDRFLLSKGHGTLAYYTALAEAGFFPISELEEFETPESWLTGQPSMYLDKGIELASGSLGLGLSVGVGIALAARKKRLSYKTYVLMGDGECNEGTVWEAAMAASQFHLDNLVAVLDANGMQSDGPCTSIMDMGSHMAKWQSFGWETLEAEGHDVESLYDVFTRPAVSAGKPRIVIAKTVKGKGVSFMENNNEWHFSRLTQEQYAAAMAELENKPC